MEPLLRTFETSGTGHSGMSSPAVPLTRESGTGPSTEVETRRVTSEGEHAVYVCDREGPSLLEGDHGGDGGCRDAAGETATHPDGLDPEPLCVPPLRSLLPFVHPSPPVTWIEGIKVRASHNSCCSA